MILIIDICNRKFDIYLLFVPYVLPYNLCNNDYMFNDLYSLMYHRFSMF